jgi:hypothetical protein
MEEKAVITKSRAASEAATPPSCFTIAQFCERNHLSVAFYYKLRTTGCGPREMEVGRRRFVSVEAEAVWRRKCEGAS